MTFPIALHAGLINAGVALNIVPGTAAVKFEIRNLPVDSPDKYWNGSNPR